MEAEKKWEEEEEEEVGESEVGGEGMRRERGVGWGGEYFFIFKCGTHVFKNYIN